ncbi:S1 domain-containing RNA-binding protein [Lentilactobacillus hilgardii]|uniref:S1 RNA binding domain protein n=1 Tax=Lentilactobacillus hilgardii (strain ATCC 8290 / DSM 20176 / CCUG 30140 / JCM 1155 / KCTC 3500 / NBRC 15886 / NCIMB 8040 / NRRL B-1843 / 9) TaxID=1423757 RepID=C0XFV5_LENH9|nr:S1 domain-containing RNA-binding protein [Lentilactobacillus hilgardii]EEI19808.1 S1 RNA binding domain protein [Lentilactobacillus buchneri ATCC 11577]EEI25777.1 S1 RNA binding domain protein [Lentilactobacillus hilgardii DSM 20176 = ATCC 8290]KRK56551.1 RNA-binding protein [Lentilactobacillus hilgardii DSM 20176 = ATCC 8290]MCP9332501.1 RNA-binding protein S1 [Lentilactobacillus hilgardii]MCP9349108.1 RNA-binding protein S1 [Lentilactobacillus hilgardii]
MAIEVGEKVNGKVSGITNFGAFIDLGDHRTGLVHISEVSDGFVKDIHDVLKVGDEVTVKVLKIEGNNKISLSIRKATDSSSHEGDHESSHGNYSHHNEHEHENSHDYHENHGHHSRGNHSSSNRGNHSGNHPESFDDLMSGFLKQSEDRLATLRKNTEGKRGGRGGRRS